jgi:RNA-binding protein YhbY
MTTQLEIQLGKKGLTPEFVSGLKKRFENPKIKNIKITVLRSARENRSDVKKYAEELQSQLGNKFSYKIIGFSIFILKWRKERSE